MEAQGIIFYNESYAYFIIQKKIKNIVESGSDTPCRVHTLLCARMWVQTSGPPCKGGGGFMSGEEVQQMSPFLSLSLCHLLLSQFLSPTTKRIKKDIVI